MHTPGNWTVSGSPQWSGFKVVDANGRSVAAFPSTSTRPDPERAANAKLIAAAPALLRVLQAWIAYRDELESKRAPADDIENLADEARTIIKQATTENAT